MTLCIVFVNTLLRTHLYQYIGFYFRCEIILRRLMNCTPSLSDSERIMHTELREMEDKLKQTEHYIKQVTESSNCTLL